MCFLHPLPVGTEVHFTNHILWQWRAQFTPFRLGWIHSLPRLFILSLSIICS